MTVYLLAALVGVACVTCAQGLEAGAIALPGLVSPASSVAPLQDAVGTPAKAVRALTPHALANLLWLVAFLALFVPAALRYDIGVDYSATMESSGYLGYVQIFETYAHAPMDPGMDVGFYVLIRALGLVTNDPQWLFVVLAALVYALVLRACRRLSASPALSLVLFLASGLYFESLNIARQWVAIACVLNGLAWVRAGECGEPAGWKRLARYAAWVVAGSLMHSSCLLWLAMWPLVLVPMSSRRSIVLLAVVVSALCLSSGVVSLLAQGTRFGRYLDPSSPVYVGPQPRPNAVITSTIMWTFSLWAWWRPSRLDRWAGALLVCQTVGLALTLSGFFLPFIVDRVARYFTPLLVLQLPLALAQVADARLRRALTVVVVVAWLAATYVQVIAGGQYGVVPYQSVFGAAAAAGILS